MGRLLQGLKGACKPCKATESTFQHILQATPVFWVADICMMFFLAILLNEGSRVHAVCLYVCRRLSNLW